MNNEQVDKICSICCEENDEVFHTLKCGHSFHYQCHFLSCCILPISLYRISIALSLSLKLFLYSVSVSLCPSLYLTPSLCPIMHKRVPPSLNVCSISLQFSRDI